MRDKMGFGGQNVASKIIPILPPLEYIPARKYDHYTFVSDSVEKKPTNQADTGTDIALGPAMFILAVLVIYGLVVLSPALNIGFYADDYHYLPTPKLETWSDVPEVIAYSAKRAPRVITQGLYFVIGRSLWDLDHRAWHIPNFFAYAMVIFLLYAFLARVLRDRLSALVGSGIFALSGVIFWPMMWTTGIGELISFIFVFSGLLAHAKAEDTRRETGVIPVGLEVLSVILIGLALLSKETMVLVVIVYVLMDLFMRRRVSFAGFFVVLLGAGAMVMAVRKLTLLQADSTYKVSLNIEQIFWNLGVYFFDPIVATGGQYGVMRLFGFENSPGVLEEFVQLLKANLGITAALAAIALTIVVLWIRLTLVGWRAENIPEAAKKPLVPPIFGWLGWLIVLSLPLFTPGHHYSYYLTIPLGLLMIAAAPVIASALRIRKWRPLVVFLLILYMIWFPINTNLAFKNSSCAIGCVESLKFYNEMTEMHPTIPAGTLVVLDNADSKFIWTLYFGAGIETYYPGTTGLVCADLNERIDNPRNIPVPVGGPVLVFREVDGVWTDVTDEMESRVRELLDAYNPTQ